jgi:hypothetical protein
MHAVEHCQIELGQRLKTHHPGRVHHHVDAAELRFDGVEGGGDGHLVRDIGRPGERPATRIPDLRHRGVRRVLVAREHHADRQPVRGQPR